MLFNKKIGMIEKELGIVIDLMELDLLVDIYKDDLKGIDVEKEFEDDVWDMKDRYKSLENVLYVGKYIFDCEVEEIIKSELLGYGYELGFEVILKEDVNCLGDVLNDNDYEVDYFELINILEFLGYEIEGR